jgi:hypothetical protein
LSTAMYARRTMSCALAYVIVLFSRYSGLFRNASRPVLRSPVVNDAAPIETQTRRIGFPVKMSHTPAEPFDRDSPAAARMGRGRNASLT